MNRVKELYDLIGDQLHDPEPQYVEGLTGVPRPVLLQTHKQLHAMINYLESREKFVYPGSDCQV